MSAQADDVVENSLETIAVLELEPGNWMFSAAGLVQNQDGLRNHADCQLSTAREQGEGLTFLAQLGTTGFIPLEADTPTTISVDAESFAITAATRIDEPLQIHFMCRSGGGPIRVRHAALTATRVARLTTNEDDQIQ